MADTVEPAKPTPAPRKSPRPARPDLDSWRGDIPDRPPLWRRRPRAERVRELWRATRPLLAQLGDGSDWK